MQPKPWNVHILNGLGRVQGCQQHSKPVGMVGLDAHHASRLKELPQSFVPERLNHSKQYTVLRITQQAA